MTQVINLIFLENWKDNKNKNSNKNKESLTKNRER